MGRKSSRKAKRSEESPRTDEERIDFVSARLREIDFELETLQDRTTKKKIRKQIKLLTQESKELKSLLADFQNSSPEFAEPTSTSDDNVYDIAPINDTYTPPSLENNSFFLLTLTDLDCAGGMGELSGSN